ncbi:DDE superfamily endonuclease [Phytophthora infestans]|uniref:DDE superfamily endonuclease n=1 Tax=Phytophthora infestans TaxID=4787 RepID=A0A833RYM5_PHYIN|nr:DDE superfamily endonuclease [Phytophthora infestans]
MTFDDNIAPYLDPTSPLRNSSWIYKVTLFVQDNAPAQRAKATSSWLKELKLKSLGHPPQGPGLNPIENLWFLMKPELSKDPALAQLSWNLIRRVET